MHLRVRRGFLTLSALVTLGAPCATLAQAPDASKTSTPAVPANFSQPVAVVNGENITRGELISLLSQFQIPAGNEEQIYKDGVESLINAKLINQYLIRQKISVPEEKVTERVASLEKELKQRGTDLPSEILRTGMSLPEIRKQYANRLRWEELLNERGRDSELFRFYNNHKDLFSGTQVKASHVLIKVEPDAKPEAKAKVREKLLAIKKGILDKQMTFAEAANKFSEDPGNTNGAGGDIGYFTLNGTVVEEFAKPAFALKRGEISDPVETPYGFHLIEVTDRKEGNLVDFEQNKPLVKQVFAAELQKTLLTAERKAAKIEIKPMPADLFPSSTTPSAAPAAKPEAAKPSTDK